MPKDTSRCEVHHLERLLKLWFTRPAAVPIQLRTLPWWIVELELTNGTDRFQGFIPRRTSFCKRLAFGYLGEYHDSVENWKQTLSRQLGWCEFLRLGLGVYPALLERGFLMVPHR